jgi:Ca2+-binding EF-hand superfamily protein
MPVELILQREDKNGDGKVSREEFRGPPQLFERWDTNKDGFLIKEEFEAGMAVAPGK